MTLPQNKNARKLETTESVFSGCFKNLRRRKGKNRSLKHKSSRRFLFSVQLEKEAGLKAKGRISRKLSLTTSNSYHGLSDEGTVETVNISSSTIGSFKSRPQIDHNQISSMKPSTVIVEEEEKTIKEEISLSEDSDIQKPFPSVPSHTKNSVIKISGEQSSANPDSKQQSKTELTPDNFAIADITEDSFSSDSQSLTLFDKPSLEQKLAQLDERTTEENPGNTLKVHSDVSVISLSLQASEASLPDAHSQPQSSVSIEEETKSQDIKKNCHVTSLPFSNQEPKITESQETALIEEETKQQNTACIEAKINSDENTVSEEERDHQRTPYNKNDTSTQIGNKSTPTENFSALSQKRTENYHPEELNEYIPEEDIVARNESEDLEVLFRCRSNSTSATLEPSDSSDESSNVGHLIRTQILEGSVFDTDDDSISESYTDNHTSQVADNPQLLNQKYYNESKEISVIVNLPFEQDGESNLNDNLDSGSDEATVSSEELFLMQLEELYSHITNGERDISLQTGDLSSVCSSKSGMSRDDSSTQSSSHSSVLSFDSAEFLEDDFDETYCESRLSSLHDITTIAEENEEDMVEEQGEEEKLEEGRTGLQLPLNTEINMRRQFLVSQQGSEMSSSLSTITDGSYTVSSLNTDQSPKLWSTKKTVSWEGGLEISDNRALHEEGSGLEEVSNGSTNNRSNYRSITNLKDSSQFTIQSSKLSLPNSSNSFETISSESVRYMVDILKQEAERRGSKIRARIARLREDTENLA